MESKPHVLMFGPSLNATGGISNVVNNLIQAGLTEHARLTYISTVDDGVSGNYLVKIGNAIRAYALLLAWSFSHPNIVHIHLSQGMSFYRKLPIFLLARFLRIKVIVHLHGSSFDQFYESGAKLRRFLVQWMFGKADVVIVLSEYWKVFVDKLSPAENTKIIYNGALLNQFEVKKQDLGQISIAFMGRLGKRKGTYDLLQAFSRLSEHFDSARLVLGGDGEIEEVSAYIEKAGLKDRVDVLGWVTGSKKIQVFNEADIYVLPSYNEGLPGSILEAMAAGTPIISTPVGGIPEAVIDGYNGYLVAPGDVDGLFDRLSRLCEDAERRSVMGKHSRELVIRKFDMANIVKQVSHVYDTLI